jgi:hypothetical protein
LGKSGHEKFLVPTDFSTAADNATKYSMNIALEIGAN